MIFMIFTKHISSILLTLLQCYNIVNKMIGSNLQPSFRKSRQQLDQTRDFYHSAQLPKILQTKQSLSSPKQVRYHNIQGAARSPKKYQQQIQNLVQINKPIFENDTSQTSHSPTNAIHSSYLSVLKKLRRKTHEKSNIKTLLKTQFPLVHSLMQRYFNFKSYTKQDQQANIFLIWVDSYVSQQFIKRLKGYQRINHFPLSNQLGKKHLLAQNMQQANLLMPQLYDFHPSTWVLPQQSDLFKMQRKEDKFYIVKPYASCQGKGIYLTKNPQFMPKEECIVQQYIQRPMLIDGCKFDLRIYVLLRSLHPLRIYVYKQGLCRLATSTYQQPQQQNIKNDKMHLTNYAINKFSPSFVKNSSIKQDNKGHKRSLTAALKILQQKGHNPATIQTQIDQIVLKTILSCYKKMFEAYQRARQAMSPFKKFKQTHFKEEISAIRQESQQPSVCFQLMGFDIMLLQSGRPVLLQVNHQPSLSATSPLDTTIKSCLIMDTINILNMQEQHRQIWDKCQQDCTSYRIKNIQEKQLQNMGGYRRIYPLVPSQNQFQCDLAKTRAQMCRNIIDTMSGGTKVNKIRTTSHNKRQISSRMHIAGYLQNIRINSQACKRTELSINPYRVVDHFFQSIQINPEIVVEDSLIKNHLFLKELQKQSSKRLKDVLRQSKKVSHSMQHSDNQKVTLKTIQPFQKETFNDFCQRKSALRINRIFKEDMFQLREQASEPIKKGLPRWNYNRTISQNVSTQSSQIPQMVIKRHVVPTCTNIPYCTVDSNQLSQKTQQKNLNKISTSGASRIQRDDLQQKDLWMRERIQKLNNLKLLKTHVQKLKLTHKLNKSQGVREELNFINSNKNQRVNDN